MSENNSGPINAILGVVEGAVGIVKQLIGIVFNRGDLQEGQAQQDKAAVQRKVASKEAEAERRVLTQKFRNRVRRRRKS